MQLTLKSLILACLMLPAALLTGQQDRYLQEVFDDVAVTTEKFYAANYTVELLPLFGIAIPEELTFDFYEPLGDTLPERPLFILIHGGNFLPPATNGTVFGERSDSSNVEIATRLAKMGYTVAAIDHRLGWNLEEPAPERRAWGYIQALYRGVQDARSAVRFFRREYDINENTYRIDPDRIGLWGIESGGYIALGAAYLDKFSELENTTAPEGKFFIDLDGDGSAETPMISEPVHGNVFGTSPGVSLADTPYHPVDGDSLASPIYPGFDSDIQLCVNTGGAIGDLSWINAGEPPLISFHSITDPFAPYDDGVATIRTTGDSLVRMQGSRQAVEKALELGLNAAFSDINFSDGFTEGARTASAAAGHSYHEGLYPFVLPDNSNGNPESEPWQWWDSEFWATVDFDENLNADQAARLYNEPAGPERARAYIDTMLNYFAPRAAAAFELVATSTRELLTAGQVGLQVAPNPAGERLLISSHPDHPMRSLEIFDVNGHLVRQVTGLHTDQLEVARNGLPAGIYIARLTFLNGIVSQRMVFR